MKKNAVMTGAGSGVGAATAVRLVKEGWHVALIGRHEETLRATAKSTSNPGACLFFPCDISNEQNVAATGREILQKLGEVELLVNAAGPTAPRQRSREVRLR